ncbi:MAG: DUF1294 domain-containing protein [Thermoplasmatota archaeon]
MVSTLCLAMWSILVVVNLVALVVVRHDKRVAQASGERAVRRSNLPQGRRVPEVRFWQFALGGAGPAVLLGFFWFRHKTRKRGLQAKVVVAGLLGAVAWTGWLWGLGCIAF